MELTDPALLLAVMGFDAILGDPRLRWHPVVLMGKSLSFFERRLLEPRMWNRGGGVLLFVLLALLWVGGVMVLERALVALHPSFAWWTMALLGGILISFRSLLEHVGDICPGAHDLKRMRWATSMLVGRDTETMDEGACRRAGVESLSENLVDGVISPLFWLALFGLPGLVCFKVVSTMDSMVGYRNERYERFGWAGARLDDVLNWIPARLSWLLIALVAALTPGLSGAKAWKVGWEQHQLLPGFNSGWPEASFAGALERKLVGPIYRDGELATDLWLGVPEDPPLSNPEEVRRAAALARHVVVLAVGLAALFLWLLES